ncbi:MAG: hypothetical protein ACRDOJ_01685 [Nocardioidaceae bacterium]
MGADSNEDAEVLAALVVEVMRKSGLCWVRLPGGERDHAVWHVWHDGAAYVVSGGTEQPLPGIDAAESATVIARTKDSRQRVLAWTASVSTLRPDDPDWDEVVRTLIAARLNLRSTDDAAHRWAEDCIVTRLRPTGVLEEHPGAMPVDEGAAAPLPTSATTRRGLPRVLHRRQTHRPKLR